MEGFYLALGVTVVLPFAQWMAPTMPRHVAYAGVAGGILIMFAEFLDPATKPPFSVVILFLIGALCIGGAAHLYIQHLKRPADKVADSIPSEPVPTVTPAAPASAPSTSSTAAPQNEKRPWLEASKNSEINARGALITGEFPGIGQFAKLDDHSKLNMDGVMIIGQNAPTIFPPPTGELSGLSNAQIHEESKNLIHGLLEFEKEYESQLVDSTWATNKTMDERQAKMNQNRLVFQRYAQKYSEGALPSKALSLVSEILLRTNGVDPSGASQKAQQGAFVVMQKRFAGETPAASAASFLEFIAQKLPN